MSEAQYGSFPTLITPFYNNSNTNALAIDFEAIDILVDWHLANGCIGIFSPCQFSEMYHLSSQERLELAERVHRAMRGRGRHVAVGTYGGSIEEQAEFVKEMGKRCDVVVVVTCFLDDDETASPLPSTATTGEANQKNDKNESSNVQDIAWKKNAQKLLDLTPGIPLGLYECPLPYKRLLTPSLLQWCAETGRFHFHKDTCCNIQQIQEKIAAVKNGGSSTTPFRFYNANVETLAASLRFGADGFSGISANFYPQFHRWLIQQQLKCSTQENNLDHNSKNQHDVIDGNNRSIILSQIEAVQDFLTLAEQTVVKNYPCSAKVFLRELYDEDEDEDCDESLPPVPWTAACRCGSFVCDEQDKIRLAALRRTAKALSASLGIREVPLGRRKH